ncbi:hypothetical protein [Paraflavitalea speifideaquila]|uniref:hypothetical protein n=1 Tax=Paraflavitalea speifideaquila TaxID=3076558 RepID=UPI0028ED5345|nr:hypothetical protein [Paraflavitalea speifideiaquila]
MRTTLFSLCLIMVFMACSKDHKDDPSTAKYEGIVGTWVLSDIRSDPGDGSGTWRKPEKLNYVFFGPKGLYKDSRNPLFNRYTLTKDTIALYNTANPTSLHKLAVQQLNADTLTYYFGWPWCGGPTGDRFLRFSEICTIP